MAARSWEDDFRKDAIKASIRKLGAEHRADPFRFDGSFCLPVAERPVTGWTPGRFSLIAMIVGFALLALGLVIVTAAEAMGAKNDLVLLSLAGFCSLSGIAAFFVPVKGDKLILRWLLGDRVRSRLHEFDSRCVMSSELRPHGPALRKMLLGGNDHVILFFDDENEKIMIEGTGARYQIRARDVESLHVYDFMNCLGAEITCRIDEDTRLEIALARASVLYEIMKHIPLFLLLKKHLKNPLLERCERTLQFADAIELDANELELAE